MKTLLALTVHAAAVGSAENLQPPVKMEKFVVGAKPLLCFGIAIEMWENKSTQRVMEMYVRAVQPGSMAEDAGIVPGTRIYGINGIPADSLEATFLAGSELNRIFVDRLEGDRVTLEIKLPGKRGTRFVTLVEHKVRNKVTISPPPIH
jgi:C-terminal processing protease CtpA/Prc